MADAVNADRARLLAALAESDLGRIETRVAYILRQFPETRDSDIALAIRYWRRFDAATLAQWERLELEALYELENLESLSRARRRVQNDYRLYQGTRRTRESRSELQLEFERYVAEKKTELPEIRVYLDETGCDPQSTFVGLGGVCVVDWRQFAKYHASIEQWRREHGGVEPIRFASTDSNNLQRRLELMAVVERQRGGLLFCGHGVVGRGDSHRTIAGLLVQLVVDCVERMENHGCLNDIRAVRVIKEQEQFFDARYLEVVKKELDDLLAERFRGRVFLRDVEPKPKGADPLLECADLIAGSMQRRHLSPKDIHKDRLAEAVLRSTGLDSIEDEGAIFKLHGWHGSNNTK